MAPGRAMTGRVPVLDLRCVGRWNQGVVVETVCRGGFGSVGPDAMLGDFQIWHAGGVSHPEAITQGLYRLALVRR